MLEFQIRFHYKEKRNLPNDAINGPIARASACKLLNIPKIVPFSLCKP
jgi:hypothetical protein